MILCWDDLPSFKIFVFNQFPFSCLLCYLSSVQFSRSVMSDSLGPHELQHARPPCPSPTPGVHLDSHPYTTTGKTIALTRWTFADKVMSLLFNMLFQFNSVTQSCLTLWDPMNCSTPGLPVHHQLPEFTKTHVHMLSRLVITFLPRGKRLLISWRQSPTAVILEPPKIKSATVSTVSSSISHEWDWIP